MSAPLLRRLDQLTIAVLTTIAMVGATVWWLGAGGLSGGLIEIDNAPGLDYQFSVDINQAEWPELAQLPGIGETLAKRIIEGRETLGRFRSIEELDQVNGIGPRKLEQMRRYLVPMPSDAQVALQ